MFDATETLLLKKAQNYLNIILDPSFNSKGSEAQLGLIILTQQSLQDANLALAHRKRNSVVFLKSLGL